MKSPITFVIICIDNVFFQTQITCLFVSVNIYNYHNRAWAL